MRAQDEAAILACIPSLRRYARGLVSDRDRADDLVQDTLERAWSRFSLWQRRGELRAWMFGIMHNQFIDRLRAQRAAPDDFLGDREGEGWPEQAQQRPQQADALEVRDLDRLLQRLPPEQREVLLLVAVEELSYAEVAQALGLPIGTVMSRLSRARARLREELTYPQQNNAAAPALFQRVK